MLFICQYPYKDTIAGSSFIWQHLTKLNNASIFISRERFDERQHCSPFLRLPCALFLEVNLENILSTIAMQII